MAPKTRVKKENDERQKRILVSKERIMKIKRDILSIVEAMLEEDIARDWFLENVIKLCHADYDDVIQERSIEHLCGYPLCSNPLKENMKQKYHISPTANKVFDITERKNFCGNQCFKASQHLKDQLSPIPLYMRKDVLKIEVNLYCDNIGSAGEEVQFHHKIPEEEVEKVCTVQKACHYFVDMLHEEIKNCSDSLSGLEIRERVFEKQFFFEDQQSEDKKCDSEEEKEPNGKLEISDDSDEEKLFPAYDNLSILQDTHMPVPKKSTKSQLIPAKPILKKKTQVGSHVNISLNTLFSVFKDWMTEDSMKYLLGEKYVYGLKADQLFEKMTASDVAISPDKLSSIKNEYINLCLKIDSLSDLGDSTEIEFLECTDVNPDCTIEARSGLQSSKRFKKRSNSNFVNEVRKVTFATDSSNLSSAVSNLNSTVSSSSVLAKNEAVQGQTSAENSKDGKNVSLCETKSNEKTLNSRLGTKKQEFSSTKKENKLDDTDETSEVSEPKSPAYEGGLPYVDSVSQNALRKQVLTSKFKTVYEEFLPTIGLQYPDIRKSVKAFVGTLSLTPTNVMFRPKEWKVICLVLLRILTRTVLKNLQDEEKFIKICEDPIMPMKIDLEEIDRLISDILSPEKILTLPVVPQ